MEIKDFSFENTLPSQIKNSKSSNSNEYSSNDFEKTDKILDTVVSSIGLTKESDHINSTLNTMNIDAQFHPNSSESLLQIEVSTNSENHGDTNDVEYENQGKNQMEHHRDYWSCSYEKLEDSELSYVMNDHNYISQQLLYSQNYLNPMQQTTDIREAITKFLLKKEETDESNYLKIDSFVDNVMQVISSFSVLSEDNKEFFGYKKENTDSNGSQQRNEIKESSENKKAILKEEIIEQEFLTNQEMTEFEKIYNSHKSDVKSPHIVATSTYGIEEVNALLLDQCTEKSDSNYKNSITNEVSRVLPENSLEPIEYFEFSSDTSLGDSSENFCQKDVIKNIFNFASKLLKQCKSFNDSNNINEFLLNQLLEFKKLVNMVCCIDSSVQTEKLYSKQKLKRINAKEKKLLLASSYSSSTSDEMSDFNQCNSDNMIYKFESSKSSNSLNSLRRHERDHNKKLCLESVDIKDVAYISQTESDKSDDILSQKCDISKLHSAGVSKYTDKNFEATRHENYDKGTIISNPKFMPKKCSSELGSELDSNESDKENSTQQKFEADVSDVENNTILTNSAEKRCIANDFDDKEINRLTNLKDLLNSKKKPSSKNSLPTMEKLKSKSKSLLTRKRSNTLITVMQEVVANNSQTDESMSDSGDPVLTEKQFLKQCNDRLKHQLLEASSESEISDDDEKLKNLLIKDNVFYDEDRKSPLVDKFLKAFNVKDIDNDEENKIQSFEAGRSTVNIETNSNTNEIILKGPDIGNENLSCEKNFISTEKTIEKTENQFLGCHLSSESLKRTQKNPKSLEKLLSEADKRKNIAKVDENLISLSSASDSSDVEECSLDVSEEQEKRLIKPMLRQDQLAGETRKAQKEEADRIRRLERKHTLLCKAKKEFSKEVKNDLILDYNSETKTFIKVHPEIVKHLKTHQIDGIKFMYDSCYGGVDALKKSEGSGCILAHCMGLGKTLQLIALLHTVISYKELKTTKILVLCPKSTVMNWADEIFRWLGPLNTKTLRVFSFNDISDINEKLDVLHEWSISSSKAGCLLIGYEAFRTLVFYHNYKNRGNLTKDRLEDIKEKVSKYLLKPGADLVVCDEGHIIKNRKSAISLAVSEIVTPKRIILTGTPIQNNLKEYYSMVNFIKPLFLGTEKEFANLYANPIKNGQHKDSSKRDIKVMKQRSFVLHKKLSKFVQRKEAELLKTFLPPKFEYVLFVPMTEIQNNLYEFILEAISKREDNKGKSLITDYTCLRKIWTHPKVLEDAWKNAVTAKNKKDGRRNAFIHPHSDDDQPDDFLDSQTGIMSVTRDWWRNLLSQKDLQTIFPSNKLRTMFEILRMCEENGEKCLIFSAFVAVLNVVEFFLKKMQEIHANSTNEVEKQITWILGQDYYRLDGKTPKSIRHEMIKRFNDPDNKKSRLFLISAKAGGQGINLTGANRVIILDTSWNPSNDQQNIFRIFRLGQQKICYIYRLIAMGTMEEKVYSRSVTKQAMSFRVVDEQQIDRHYSMAELAELYTLTKPNYAERPMPIFPQDNILANLLLNYPHLVYKYHEHDSLLENKIEQELSEQEKADAWAAYERDLQMNSEMKNPANFEGIVNPFSQISAQNYLATMAGGFDARNFPLNYGLNQQTVGAASLTQSLLSNYNFSGNNQAYFDMMNMYRNFSPSLLYGMNQTSTLQPYSSTYGPVPQATGVLPNQAIPNILSASSSNSLSALGSISSFNASNTVFPPQLSMFSTSSPSYPPTSTPALNHTSELSSFEQYKRSLENSFNNLSNYTSSFSNVTKRKDLSYAMTPSPSATKQTSKKTTSQINSQNSYSNALPVIDTHQNTLSLPLVSTSTNSLLGCNTGTNSANIPSNITNGNISVNVAKKGGKNKILVEKPVKNIYPETTTENIYSASKNAIDSTYLSLGENQLEVTNPTSSANTSMVYSKNKLPPNYKIDSLSKGPNNHEEIDLVQECNTARESLKGIINPFSTDIVSKTLHEKPEKQTKSNEMPNPSKNCLVSTSYKPSVTTPSTISTSSKQNIQSVSTENSKLSKRNLKITEASSKNSLRTLNYVPSNDVCFSSVKNLLGKNDTPTVSAISDSNVKLKAIKKMPNPTFHTTNLSQKNAQHKVKIPSLSLSKVEMRSSNITSAITSRSELNPNSETKRPAVKNSTRFPTESKPTGSGVFIIKNNKNSKICEELFAEKGIRLPLERKRIAISPTANNSESHCTSPQVKQMKLSLPPKKNKTRQCNPNKRMMSKY